MKTKKSMLVILLILITLFMGGCDAWDNHKANDNWPATSNPVSETAYELLCVDPGNNFSFCK